MALPRRQTLPDGSRFMPGNVAEHIEGIAFRMLRNAGTNPALLDDVSTVLVWIRDLTEDEATEVIDRLSAVEDDGLHNRCSVLLYFSLFREGQLPDLPPFDPARFKDRLHRELMDGEPRFRTSLMWQVAGGAEEKTYPYEMMRPYLPSFVSGPYDAAAFLHLRRICELNVKDNPDSLCPILLEALERAAEYIAVEPRSRAWSVDDLPEFLDLLAESCPQDCVLDGVALMLDYKSRIPGISGRALAAILGKYQSARADELRARNVDGLGA
jgi:hypothetical protein